MPYCSHEMGQCPAPGIDYPAQSAFFAYSSADKPRASKIRDAIRKINDGALPFRAIDWSEDLKSEGRIIFCEICKAIRTARFVVADISDLNCNVLFEFGFALGCDKYVWPICQESAHASNTLLYKQFDMFAILAHSRYSSSETIIKRMRKKEVWTRSNTILDVTRARSFGKSKILYLKSPHVDPASIQIYEMLGKYPLTTIIDDPTEDASQKISWYLDALSHSTSVIIHMAPEHSKDAAFHNAKASFVAGLATALDIDVLLLASKDFFAPIDYASLVTLYKSSATVKDRMEQHLLRVKQIISDSTSVTTPPEGINNTLISRIDVGDYVAEREQNKISDIFLDTPFLDTICKNKNTIVVGRKGSGKSALFYKLLERAHEEMDTFICDIKPVGYELDRLVDFIKRIDKEYEQSHFTESLWKFLVYSEILHRIHSALLAKPRHTNYTPEESAIFDIAEEFQHIKEYQFSSRISILLDQLFEQSQETIIRISEILHNNHLKKMRHAIRSYIHKKRELVLLIDGLDANWRPENDDTVIARLLSGLLGATEEVWSSLLDRSEATYNRTSLTFVTFIRSDIFSILIDHTTEKDKLKYELLMWEDKAELFDIVTKRLFFSLDGLFESEQAMWLNLLEPQYTLADFKNDIYGSIIPRPRDIIYLFNEIIGLVRAHKVAFINRQAFKQAQREYSFHAFNSLVSESFAGVTSIENAIIAFSGRKRILTESEIQGIYRDQGIESAVARTFTDFLMKSSFLGIETSENQFEYVCSPLDLEKHRKRNQVYQKSRKKGVRYQIHKAFVDFLDLE